MHARLTLLFYATALSVSFVEFSKVFCLYLAGDMNRLALGGTAKLWRSCACTLRFSDVTCTCKHGDIVLWNRTVKWKQTDFTVTSACVVESVRLKILLTW